MDEAKSQGLTLLRLLFLPTSELALDGLPNKARHTAITDKRPNPLPDFLREANQRRLDSQ